MDYLDGAQDFVTKLVRWRAIQADGYLVSRGPERVPEVSELRRSLVSLGTKDLKYFDEGLDCIQYAQAPRAAIVLGWTGFIDLLQSKIGRDNYASLNSILKLEFHAVHKKVGHIKTREALIDNFDDALLLEAGRKLNFYDKHVWTQLNAMRDERNNCAHVEEYAVNVRIALGFYAHLIKFLPYVL
jgi:hypothetical protein